MESITKQALPVIAYDGSGLVYLGDIVDSGFETKKEDLPDPGADIVTYHLSGLSASEICYFVVTAYDTEGLESAYSNEIVSSGLTSFAIITAAEDEGGGCFINTARYP